MIPPVIDLHCDLPSALIQENKEDLESRPKGHIDLPRARAGGLRAVFAVAFVHDKDEEPALVAERQLRLTEDLARRHPESCLRATSADSLDQAHQENKLALFSGIENGKALDGDLGRLDAFYALGARYLGIVWNGANALGQGCAEPKGGLTDLGRRAVERAEALGYLIDTAHLNEAGFEDLLRIHQRPLINSHSNCRAVHEHKRNLRDGQIRAIAASGGVVGLNFYPPFVAAGGVADIQDMIRHIEHALEVGGEGAVAIGSDFDGIDRSVEGLPDSAAYPALWAALRERGFSRDLIEKLAWRNVERVLREALN